MKIEQKDGYKLIINDEPFEEFISVFKEKHITLIKNHLIIKISNRLSVNSKDIFILLQYAEEHQKNGTTFVIVCGDIDIDNFPDFFNIVPTLQEAEDVLEMENIQRDLGF